LYQIKLTKALEDSGAFFMSNYASTGLAGVTWHHQQHTEVDE